MNKLLLAVSTAISAGCLSTPAFAVQEDQISADNGGIVDIVVTAQRRSETVQNVPIAISAFSADQMQTQGISSALELGRFVPNLVTMNNTGVGSANAIYLRGLGNTETIPTFDPPVGTYVDDIYLSRQNANNLNFFDVERVEVLRGPQGTLFGRNTTGGAVSVIMKDPGDEFGGYGEIGYGRFNKKSLRGSVDLPLADTLAVKVSGYWQNDDGYVKNITTGQRLNDDDGWGVRLGIKGDLSPSVRFRGSYAHIVANGENILNSECDPRTIYRDDVTPVCDGRYASTGMIAGRPSANSVFADMAIAGRKKTFQLGNYTQTDLVTMHFDADLSDNLTLSSITGFVSQDQQYAMDFYDGRSGPSLSNPVPPVMGYAKGGFVILNDGQHEQISQEIKLNGSFGDGFIDFVTGAFYLREQNRTDFADLFALSASNVLVLSDRILRNTTEALAGYAQGDINVSEKLKLTAGIRYTHETKKFDVQDNKSGCNDGTVEASCMVNDNLISPSGLLVPPSQKAKIWTPRFAVNYKANRDILLFASATRGFKSGGWNARATATNAFLPFGPEKIWSYEAGIKSDWFNRRVRANLTVFHSDVSDLQTPSALVNPNGSATFITRNFADFRNRGAEAELTFQPTPEWNLYFNAGYQDAKFVIDRDAADVDEYGIQSVNAQQLACLALLAAGNIPGGTGTTAACGAGIIAPNGNIAEPTRVPKWTLAMGTSYELALGRNGMTLVPAVNASYRGAQETNAANFTIYGGQSSGTNGSYPANPYGGQILNGSYSPSVWFVNASVALNGEDKKWQLSLSCTNCFDQVAANTSLVNTRYIDHPMTWSIKARHNF
jgi:iron complex outermembrane receptor protein